MQDLRILFTDREAYRYRFGHGTQDGDSLTHLIAQEENAREEQRLELEYPIFNLWRLLRFVRKTRVTDPGTSDDWFFLFVIWSLITVGLRLFEILFTIATSEGEVTFSCFPLMATAVVTGFVTPHLIHGRTWLKHRHERQKERERIRSTPWTDALVERTRLHIEEHRRLLLGDENNSSNDGTSGEIQSALRELEHRSGPELRYHGHSSPAVYGYRETAGIQISFEDLLAEIRDMPSAHAVLLRYRDLREATYKELTTQARHAMMRYRQVEADRRVLEQMTDRNARNAILGSMSTTRFEIQTDLETVERDLFRIEQEVAKLRDTINPILWAHDTGSRTANLRVTAEATPSTVPPVQHVAAVREDVPTAKRRG